MNESLKEKDFIKELLEAVRNNEHIHAVMDDYESIIEHIPFWITQEERSALNEDIFVGSLNGKLTVYKKSTMYGVDNYITRSEILDMPKILDDAEDYLDVIDQLNFKLFGFKGKNYISVVSTSIHVDSRIVIMTRKFGNFLAKRYDNSAYVITNSEGMLFVFDTNEDPIKIANDIIMSDLCIKDSEFELFLIEKDELTSVYRFNTYNSNCIGKQ